MNNMINKFLLAGDKFMPEMHLKQPQFVYSDSEISHEEFTNIITETNIYENIKENIKDTAELSSLERTIEDSSLERIKEKSTIL